MIYIVMSSSPSLSSSFHSTILLSYLKFVVHFTGEQIHRGIVIADYCKGCAGFIRSEPINIGML